MDMTFRSEYVLFPATLSLINSPVITPVIFIIIITTKTKFSNLTEYNYLSLISALMRQCNTTVRVITRALKRLFSTLLASKISGNSCGLI